MLEADSTGRTRLKLIIRIRDLSFLSPVTGACHDSCYFIWKIAFPFVRKIGIIILLSIPR